jgi:DNA polymerase delta subunit 1
MFCLHLLLTGDIDDGLGGTAPAGPSSSSAAGGGGDEEVRGPHAALAVKLAQRDPGKRFLLGERLSYVLVSGARTQEEAAEDPLTAAQQALPLNYDLYWTNKLQVGGWKGKRGAEHGAVGV